MTSLSLSALSIPSKYAHSQTRSFLPAPFCSTVPSFLALLASCKSSFIQLSFPPFACPQGNMEVHLSQLGPSLSPSALPESFLALEVSLSGALVHPFPSLPHHPLGSSVNLSGTFPPHNLNSYSSSWSVPDAHLHSSLPLLKSLLESHFLREVFHIPASFHSTAFSTI